MQRLTLVLITLVLFLVACGGPAAPTAAPEGLYAPAPTQPPLATVAVGAAQTGVISFPDEPPGRMVIKDAQMELVVQDVTIAVGQITQMAADQGGYVLDSQSRMVNGNKHASLRLAVPSAAFESSLNFLRTLALQVVKEAASGQDVTADYVDLQTRLTNLEATAARVREFLKDAKTVEESLRINQQLSELEGQIAQIKGQMRYYEGRSAYSTITVQLSPQVVAATPTPEPGWNPARTFEKASKVLVKASQGLADVMIWLTIVIGPLALAGLLLLGLLRWLFRKVAR